MIECTLTIRGKRHTWNFDIIIDPSNLQEYLADGLEITFTRYVIPEWVVNLGLTRAWCFLKDIF
jgi:hypothetical protein